MLLPAGALGWRVGSAETMVGQLEHVTSLSERPNLMVGVIPWGTDPRDIARYLDLLRKLTECATFDDDARQHLSSMADQYLGLTVSWPHHSPRSG